MRTASHLLQRPQHLRVSAGVMSTSTSGSFSMPDPNSVPVFRNRGGSSTFRSCCRIPWLGPRVSNTNLVWPSRNSEGNGKEVSIRLIHACIRVPLAPTGREKQRNQDAPFLPMQRGTSGNMEDLKTRRPSLLRGSLIASEINFTGSCIQCVA
jgi:hypothetical protein